MVPSAPYRQGARAEVATDAGGFEVFISEGYSHVDIVSAEDDETNNVVAPLLAFIERNL